MGKRKRGMCKLCGKDELLCRSHIIPDFFYKPLYNEEEKGRLFSLRENSDFIGIHQSGIWLYLFCDKCEGILQKSEDYVARLFDKDLWEIARPLKFTDGKIFERGKELTEIDYSLFKLLFLSVFWRLSLRKKLFDPIQLGPYQEKLRKLILNSTVPSEGKLGIMIGRVTIQGKYIPGFVGGILSSRWGKHHKIHIVILRGYCVSLVIGKPPIDSKILSFVTRENGSQIIPLIEFESFKALHGLAERIANAKFPV